MPVTAPHPTLKKYVATADERQPFVTDLFNRSAPHYDRIVGVMSFGSGVRYRRDALVRAGLAEGMRMLDVATGTGLVARAASDVVGERGRVIGVDRGGHAGRVDQTGGRLVVQASAKRCRSRADDSTF
jgi:demethylmenaquinone methyltransferase/2-methoxy-6-polyprenyl-1,4-benzoquinol methylase